MVSILLFAVPGTYEKDYATSFMEAETTARVRLIGLTSIDYYRPVSTTDDPMIVLLFGIKRDVEKHLGSSVENPGVEGLKSYVDCPMANELYG
jgi:hypothetical protein